VVERLVWKVEERRDLEMISSGAMAQGEVFEVIDQGDDQPQTRWQMPIQARE
jgi:hypothetical protein